MSIAAAHQAGPPVAAAPVGKIAAWLDGLPESEHTAALAILRDSAWPHARVAELFIENGLDVSPQSIGAYRKKLAREAG